MNAYGLVRYYDQDYQMVHSDPAGPVWQHQFVHGTQQVVQNSGECCFSAMPCWVVAPMNIHGGLQLAGDNFLQVLREE